MRPPVISQPARLSEVMERVETIRTRCAALARQSSFVTSLAAPRTPQFASKLAALTGPGAGPEIRAAIAAAAAQHGLDPAILTALAHVESGFRPDAVSPDGALGIAQLMPATARELGVADPFDLRASLDGGARYLKEQLSRFSGDLTLALAAYNAGPAAVARHGGIPPYPETRRFVSRVLDLARRYAGRVR